MGIMAKRKKKNIRPSAKNPWPKLLYEFRERYELSQADAAALAKVTRRAWLHWENGEKIPSPTYALLLQLVIDKYNSGNS